MIKHSMKKDHSVMVIFVQKKCIWSCLMCVLTFSVLYWSLLEALENTHIHTHCVLLERNADLLHEQRWLCNGLTTAGATH